MNQFSKEEDLMDFLSRITEIRIERGLRMRGTKPGPDGTGCRPDRQSQQTEETR